MHLQYCTLCTVHYHYLLSVFTIHYDTLMMSCALGANPPISLLLICSVIVLIYSHITYSFVLYLKSPFLRYILILIYCLCRVHYIVYRLLLLSLGLIKLSFSLYIVLSSRDWRECVLTSHTRTLFIEVICYWRHVTVTSRSDSVIFVPTYWRCNIVPYRWIIHLRYTFTSKGLVLRS